MRGWLMVLGCLVAAPAWACWDGIDAVGTRVSLDVYDGAARWSPALAQRYADGIRRLEALLPDDGRLEVHFDRVVLCEQALCQSLPKPWQDGDLTTLFDQVAEALEVEHDARAKASALRAEVWTIEVGQTRDRKAAQALAGKIIAGGHADPGFLEAGAQSEETDATYFAVVDGVYSVRVGAFLDRTEAASAAADLGLALGRPLTVRAL